MLMNIHRVKQQKEENEKIPIGNISHIFINYVV